MKKLIFLFLGIIIIHLQSCCYACGGDDDAFLETPFSNRYEPIRLDRSDFENSVSLNDPISIEISGKIYIQGDLLFINEMHKGFHVYDNSDPSNPTLLKFLEIPGSTDLVIRDTMIYINQASDLIAVEYNTNTGEILLTKRVVDVFPELRSPDGFLPENVSDDSVVVGWKLIK